MPNVEQENKQLNGGKKKRVNEKDTDFICKLQSYFAKLCALLNLQNSIIKAIIL